MPFSDMAIVGSVRISDDGYLIAKSKSARTGVQLYRAKELGDVARSAGFSDDDIVRVMRHESEVFSKDAMSSLIHAPVTIDHPPVFVDSDNWSKYAVGEVGSDVMRDGESLVVSLIIKDRDAIKSVSTTHKELSWGYSAEIREYKDKDLADFEMYGFKYNHISAVPKGRAGSDHRIGDSSLNWAMPELLTVEDEQMTVELKTVILGDKAVQVEAKDADTVAAILKDHKTAIDAKDAEIVKLTKERDDAQAKVLTDAQIADMVAAKIKSDADRARVLGILKDEAKVKAMSDEAIAGALAVLGDADRVDDSAREALKDHKPVGDAAYEKRIQDAQAKFLNLEKK